MCDWTALSNRLVKFGRVSTIFCHISRQPPSLCLCMLHRHGGHCVFFCVVMIVDYVGRGRLRFYTFCIAGSVYRSPWHQDFFFANFSFFSLFFFQCWTQCISLLFLCHDFCIQASDVRWMMLHWKTMKNTCSSIPFEKQCLDDWTKKITFVLHIAGGAEFVCFFLAWTLATVSGFPALSKGRDAALHRFLILKSPGILRKHNVVSNWYKVLFWLELQQHGFVQKEGYTHNPQATHLTHVLFLAKCIPAYTQ